jgi:diguanylate cyclase (GGDEF)-like protein/PAS domain S-box-containing protein
VPDPIREDVEFFAHIQNHGFLIEKPLWDFFYYNVVYNIDALILKCEEGLAGRRLLPSQEARDMLVLIKGVKDCVATVTASPKEHVIFPQLREHLPVNPVIMGLIKHQFGSDLIAIESILRDAIDIEGLHPISLVTVQKILDHARSIKKFMERLMDLGQWQVSDQKFQTFYDLFKDGLFFTDMKGQIIDANQAYVDMLGYSREELKAMTYRQLTPEKYREEEESIMTNQVVERGYSEVYEKECIRKDGSVLPISKRVWLIRNTQGIPLGMWGIIRDITDPKARERELQQEIFSSHAVIEHLGNGLTLSDDKGRFVIFNPTMEEITGYKLEEVNKKGFEALLPSEPGRGRKGVLTRKSAAPGKVVRDDEMTIRAKDGSIKTLLLTTSSIAYRGKNMFLSIWRDITETKKFESELKRLNKELEQLALKDPHTGLYNYRFLNEALEVNFSRAERNFASLSLIMMDLDYFKSVNDVYGHVFGDLILRQLAVRLNKIVRPYDVLIRYGGEEFIIISPDTNRAGGLALAKRILDGINLTSFGDRSHQIKLKLSLAVTAYPEDGILKGMELVDLADQILNRAKEAGGNRVFSSLDTKRESVRIQGTTNVNLLKNKINRLNARANQSLIEATLAFAKTIELKDHDTGNHVERTVHYATEISRKLRLSREQIRIVEQAAMLHDLGKVGISDEILRKPSKLSRAEFEEMKRHPQIGVDIIRPIQSLHPIIPAILYHHERWDGQGYPYGFEKERIPLLARIISIADVYEALVSDRPYRKAYSKREAIRIIKKSSGTQFDPDVVKTFLQVFKQER